MAKVTIQQQQQQHSQQQQSPNVVVAESGEAVQWKKYNSYYLQVNADEDDRATEISLCEFRRPHMRSFHCCWWSFFIAFFVWFTILPLLPDIRQSLNLTKEQVWTSNVIGVGGTIFIRLLLGPLCDNYGPRILFSILLCGVSIPTACLGFVNTADGLYVLRFFIGLAGGSFVMTEYWTSSLFAKKIVGTANALVAGWGNLGAGVTQLVIGSFLLPLFKVIYNGNSDKAWRSVCIIPALVAFATGVIVPLLSDDCPKGNYSKLKRMGTMKPVSMTKSFLTACMEYNTWILFIQYAACFGVELTMNNASALYFMDVFGQSAESAAAIAAIFGWMNLFARGLGGLFSDYMNHRCYGMRGRIIAQSLLLLGEGIMVFTFSNSHTLGGAIASLIVFSLFVQSAEGTSFGIVPYIVPEYTGSTTGIIGAGGNVGAVTFGLLFRNLPYEKAFNIMGYFVLGSAVITFFIHIRNESSFICNKNNDKAIVAIENESP